MGLITELLMHPEEFMPLVQLKLDSARVSKPIEAELSTCLHLPDREFCYAALNKVSRSFAYVIQILPEKLKDAICVFYLVLRALDSVEDDMEHLDLKRKLPLLNQFYELLDGKTLDLANIGLKPDEVTLLVHFEKVLMLYNTLNRESQLVIRDITLKMGKGMAEFADKVIVKTVEEWDLYCHYVAGLVGHGLTRLFVASNYEDTPLAEDLSIANSMGLFLQKTNIIRDYHEDLRDGRIFWPNQIWEKFASKLSWFADNPSNEKSLDCLNNLILNALQHIPDCLKYMSSLKNPDVFRFCAIPQVMAIATLAEIFNNSDVFRRNVKIRKGLTASIIMECKSIEQAEYLFYKFMSDILAFQKRLISLDPVFMSSYASLSAKYGGRKSRSNFFPIVVILLLVILVLFLIPK
jgi:farnesyl-diphosphate farnesyltransferase